MCVSSIFRSSSQMLTNEAVVSQLSDSLTDVVGSNDQPTEQCKSRNARTATINPVTQPVEPREHRRPQRPGIIWAAGGRLEAKDFLDKWYSTLASNIADEYFENNLA